MAEVNQKSNIEITEPADRVVVTYYTDPLCCWSWAFEPVWQRFCENYGEQIERRYVMGGMIPDWKRYTDPVNNVSAPVQMGPVWMHASAVTHVPMDYTIWHSDPPSSSYPSCIAVRNAFLQSQSAGEVYLSAVRRAVMVDRRNIARQDVLDAIANEVSARTNNVFNVTTFADPEHQTLAREAFRQDLQKIAFHKIGRFPTITLVNAQGKGLIMPGYRPFERLRQGMEAMQAVGQP
jgi:putative protein-disulfide isomerase